MVYKVFADIVVLVHFLWVVFLIFGAFAGVRFRAVRVLHIAGLAYALVLNIFGWYCPLTYVEVWARSMHDPGLAYAGSFIAHYAEELIYVSLPRYALLVITVILCGFNGWYYLKKWKVRRGR